MRKKIPETRSHFWSRVDQTAGADKCWPWQRSCRKSGHGLIRWHGRTTTAHRVAFELSKGAIPAGLIIRHACDNPVCCNPQHLLSGTQKDNTRDSMERGRYVAPPTFVGEAHPGSRLTDKIVRTIRKRRRNGEKLTAIARDYGVDRSAIYQVMCGKTWRHVHD